MATEPDFNRPLRSILVDADLRSQRFLYRFLTQDTRIELLQTYKGAKRFVNYVKNEGGIDAVFMNPELPDMSGFEALLKIPAAERPLVVMVNNRLDYAYYAYQIDACDFLNMPFTAPEFRHCLNKLLQIRKEKELFRAWENSREKEV